MAPSPSLTLPTPTSAFAGLLRGCWAPRPELRGRLLAFVSRDGPLLRGSAALLSPTRQICKGRQPCRTLEASSTQGRLARVLEAWSSRLLLPLSAWLWACGSFYASSCWCCGSEGKRLLVLPSGLCNLLRGLKHRSLQATASPVVASSGFKPNAYLIPPPLHPP